MRTGFRAGWSAAASGSSYTFCRWTPSGRGKSCEKWWKGDRRSDAPPRAAARAPNRHDLTRELRRAARDFFSPTQPSETWPGCPACGAHEELTRADEFSAFGAGPCVWPFRLRIVRAYGPWLAEAGSDREYSSRKSGGNPALGSRRNSAGPLRLRREWPSAGERRGRVELVSWPTDRTDRLRGRFWRGAQP